MLFVVPTPIGNLGDMSLRAINVLKDADFILAEDTRTSGKLLKHFNIDCPVRPYHNHNEHKIVARLVSEIKSGTTAALISDAGTPGISDPGYLLINACIEEKIKVQCLPGPTAFVPALILSGLPAHHFHFEGFLPHKKGRHTRLTYLSNLPVTFILYESPHRIKRTLMQLKEYIEVDRPVCICREISKLHEEAIRGSLAEVSDVVKGRPRIRGEIVLIVGGRKEI